MNFTAQTLILLLLFFVFLSGFVVILNGNIKNNNNENFDTNKDCPNLLIKKDNGLMLYNTKEPVEDGKNPIPFFSLDDYINYLEIQRKKGIVCPVLFLQEENNAQGQNVFVMRPSPFYVEGGLPSLPIEQHDNLVPIPVLDASKENPPFNQNMYPGFDPNGLYVGRFTDIDVVHNSTSQQKCSDNPIDTNWCGVQYTQSMIDAGKYKENEVNKVLYPHMAIV